MKKRILVVGSNFAGLTAAVELKHRLAKSGDPSDVVVIAKDADFLFMPSLIWVPFGLRKREDITFAVKPVLEGKGIAFQHATVESIDLANRTVKTSGGNQGYDYLVIATGPKLDYAAIPGLGPTAGHTQSIFSWADADRARVAFEAFEKKPGPFVVGAVQGASCFGAAYEFLLNSAYQLAKRKIDVPITYVTAEPFLGHFGLGGFGSAKKMTEYFFEKKKIRAELNASVKKIEPDRIELEDGRSIPFAYAMLAPAFLGVDAVRALGTITNARGFVKVNDAYQTLVHPEVFAAGVAVAMDQPDKTAVPCGVPKTGYLSEEMAKIVAHNIVSSIHGEPLVTLAPGAIDAKCVLDAGNTGIIMTADHLLEPRDHAWLIPGPEAHWAKLAFEKYFLATHRRGWV